MNQKLFKKFINISSPILITGETGTGKSRAARRLFDLSDIHREKFLTLHLASLKEELFESELFGHKKGAFTGAVENKTGYLQDVGRGTLFMDEIGELSLETQKKLLYLLEEKKYTPVGSTIALPFEGRIIMATNKNLKQLTEAGKFREDLYYRLTTFTFELPALSSCKDKLHREILKTFEDKKLVYGRKLLKMSPDLLSCLMESPWKGNYRELRNCLEYVVAMSDLDLATIESLPAWFSKGTEVQEIASEAGFVSHFPDHYNEALELFEAWYLKSKLSKFEGKVNETARILKISKTTLISKAKKYRIDTLSLRAEAGRAKSLRMAA